MAVEKGNKIKVEYTGTLEDGTEFDSSAKHGQPLEFEVGAGQMIKGFDAGVMGMELNEEKELTLESADAYGDVNPQLVQKVPKDKIPLPEGQELQPGMMLGMQLPNGAQLPAKIVEVSDAEVTIDLNHPLAGKKLHFKVKVVEIN